MKSGQEILDAVDKVVAPVWGRGLKLKARVSPGVIAESPPYGGVD